LRSHGAPTARGSVDASSSSRSPATSSASTASPAALLADLAVLDREIAGDKRYGGPGFSEAEIAVARELDRLVRDWGLAMYQVSLAWLLSRPAVASVIVGAENVDELRANASAADVELTPEQIDAISALTAHI
jgi:aryl-alcohol dehydrogenase-like predicted oxidoreductase